jgi:4-amino-4-deoxy-L-arabinose transferase-like glycosyltransferase
MTRHHALATDLAIAVAFTLMAFLVRRPLLMAVPRMTDETGEVATALDIAWHGARPLVHNDPYRGPAWAYLLAGVIQVTGPNPAAPRLFAAVLGALTVGVTYLLGRALAGRIAGVAAAALMTTAFGPVALFSHVAWSNHSTPLWVVLATLLLAVGTGPGRAAAAALIISGAVWGLALQSHPSAIAPLLGAGAWWLAAPARRAGLRTAGPWLALGLFVLVMSPLLVFNVQHPLASVQAAGASGQPLQRDRSVRALGDSMVGLGAQLGRTTAAGPLAEAGDPVPDSLVAITDLARPWASWLYAGLILAAWARAGLRGPRLIASMAAASLVILPLVNKNYVSLHDQRYIGYLVPLGAVAIGAGFTAAWARSGRPGRWTLAVALALLVAYPLVSIAAFYDRETAAGRTNQPYLNVTSRLAQVAQSPGQHVFVDKAMRHLDLGGGGDPTRTFEQLLTLSRVPNDRTDVTELRWFLEHDHTTTYWIIAQDATAAALAGRYALRQWEQGDGWRVLERAGSP